MNGELEQLIRREATRAVMDCCICSPTASVFRLPRNTICSSCHEGARNMATFFDELYSSPHKGLADVFKRLQEMKEVEQGVQNKIGFLDSFVLAFREGLHTDILVKPGTGPAIPAHKAILATRSVILKTMLSSDECKAPANETITLPELKHEELKCLLEFLYSGSLATDDVEKHAYSLLIAADKYDIGFLREFCEQRLLESLDSANALEVLEVSGVCSSGLLRKQAMNCIIKNLEFIVYTERYEAFAIKNPHLNVEILRTLMEMKRF
ncbi:speckle-type POZ protein [Dioscorea alata]|uniref:Speckle-type POZ protein n=2 Tax=Dioscorea alata TaxID=55571 RepID=A0ACB7U102_DIOAL|nr:speckle-type POZ protein [Dioscorea alata]